MLKVLNLYAGIGGNRKLWKDVEVTAVEYDKNIAKIYQDFFPNDKVIVTDAHQYLLEHYKEFDFIWSSPPCQTHSQLRRFDTHKGKVKYANMALYQEIILLKEFFAGIYIVENVKPYYTPLIAGKLVDRHLFWSNFNIGNYKPLDKPAIFDQDKGSTITDYERSYGFDLKHYNLTKKDYRQMLVNCVHPETGLYILNCARNIITKQNEKQTDLFENC